MAEMIDALERILKNIRGELKEAVLMENPTELDIVTAYNEGVEAMTAQVCYYINAVKVGTEHQLKLIEMLNEQEKGEQ